MSIKDSKDAQEKAMDDDAFRQFMEENEDAKVLTRKIDAKEMQRIMKEHPKMFKDSKPKEAMMVQAMKPTLGIPEESTKTVFLDPKTGKVLFSF